MTSPARTSISALPRGHEFPSTAFSIASAQVASYLAAAGDGTRYGDALPPLAAVALGLGALQEHLSLPEGALHTGQEVEHLAVAPAGETLTLTGRVAQRSERRGFVIAVIEFELSTAGQLCIRARTTIMAPAVAS